MHVLLQGAADLRAQEQLTQFLERLHLRAVESGAREARVDLTGLTFMSSSCLAALVHWIEAAQGAQAPYQIHFLANYSHRWQSRSLEALRCLAVELVHLTVA
jgi:ABC-type transporter Mla MlaB component